MPSRTALSRAAAVALLAASLVGCSSAERASAPGEPTVWDEPSHADAPTEGPDDQKERAAAADALGFWSSQAQTEGSSYEWQPSLEQMTLTSSAVIRGRVIGLAEGREIVGDTPDDRVAYPSVALEVVEVYGGTRSLAAGQAIRLEVASGMSDMSDPVAGAGSGALLFLRHLQDGPTGSPDAAFAGEPDAWRLVSPQGVVIDRGDGRAVFPITERLLMEHESRPPQDLVVWVFDDGRPSDPRRFPITHELRGRDMDAVTTSVIESLMSR